jgi:hypothetical protein
MQARMKNPGVIIPAAMTAIRALNEAIKQGGVPSRTLDLVHLRQNAGSGPARGRRVAAGRRAASCQIPLCRDQVTHSNRRRSDRGCGRGTVRGTVRWMIPGQ